MVPRAARALRDLTPSGLISKTYFFDFFTVKNKQNFRRPSGAASIIYSTIDKNDSIRGKNSRTSVDEKCGWCGMDVTEEEIAAAKKSLKYLEL